ncbi:hypothetical protein [Peribacillus alkalitolerans]|uniref:hypothetical protein n=1 Tax=Peribacillus alkalitolerans TaxID=1550385 RepID=UPI001F076B9B|nr:hypothetical protein [Peribacillus alkalitolerans]
MTKKFLLICMLLGFIGTQILIPASVSAKLFDSDSVVQLTEENGITHTPNDRGFTTLVDRSLLPENVQSFKKISVASSNVQMVVNQDNIDDYVGSFSTYDDKGYNSGLPRKGKYYNLNILYNEENIPLAYYLSSVIYEGSDDDSDEDENSEINTLVLSEESISILTTNLLNSESIILMKMVMKKMSPTIPKQHTAAALHL